jgi:ketosteroid isomerase-like protein
MLLRDEVIALKGNMKGARMPIRQTASAAVAGLLVAAAPAMIPSGPAMAQMAAFAVSEQLPDTETAAIKDMFEAATQALFDGDLDKWQSYWTEDAVLMPPGHPAVEGRAALLDFARKTWSDLDAFKLSNWTFEGRGDLAVVSTDIVWSTKGGDKNSGKQIVIAVKDANGAWKAQKVIYNTNGTP